MVEKILDLKNLTNKKINHFDNFITQMLIK